MDTPPINEPPAVPPIPPPSDAATKQWAAILHFSALAGFVFPFGNILAPLIVWQVKKAELPGLEAIGKSVMNFQISYMIYGIAATVIGIVGSCLYVPVALPFIVAIAWLVFTILGGIKASNGEAYVFPATIKFLK